MREIKFRVWCKNKNEWEKDYIVINQNGDLLQLKNKSIMPMSKENHIIEQFTGLQDKNGKEIYFGDTVKYMNGIEFDYQDEYTDHPIQIVIDSEVIWSIEAVTFENLYFIKQAMEEEFDLETLYNIENELIKIMGENKYLKVMNDESKLNNALKPVIVSNIHEQ